MKKLLVAAAAGLAVTATATSAAGATAAAPETVRVDPGRVVGRFSADSLGVDTPFWNGNLTDPATVARIRAAGIKDLDFDAGSPIDIYNWRTNGLKPDPDLVRDRANGLDPTPLRAQFSFDQFESVARKAGASTTVHVNYGTGSPAEAAAWVRYANRVRHYHLQNWMVGEEVWLDQIIEPDKRVPLNPDGTTKQESPQVNAQRYAHNLIRFSRAMKAVDPSIRIGAEGFALDPQQIADQPPQSFPQYLYAWTHALAAVPGFTDAVDYIDVHWLGDMSDDTGSTSIQLAGMTHIKPAIADLHRVLDENSRPGRRVRIIAGEVNSSSAGNAYSATAGNGVYLADAILQLFENGVIGAHWFALYSGLNTALPNGDLALLSSHDCMADDNGKQVCEPQASTPFPTYYAMQLLGEAMRHGGTLIRTTATDPVSAHTVRSADGHRYVLMVNKDGAKAKAVRLAVPGLGAGRQVRVEQTATGGIQRHRTSLGSAMNLPPYSVTLVQL